MSIHAVPLKDAAALERSPVVANNAMNRERELAGTNGYSTDLRLDVLDWLLARIRDRGEVAWLDLCCGSGRALIQAARALDERDATRGRASIVGVDLVASLDRRDATPGLEVIEANLERWSPARAFDLITCVHGLHYVGDKLGLVARAASWLAADGRFVANLDLANLRLAPDGRPAARTITKALRAEGLRWDGRRRLLCVDGPRSLGFGLESVGADDAVGPNSTGQPAVSSHYRPLAHGAERRRGP